MSKIGKQALGFVEKDESGGPAFKREPSYVVKVLSKLFFDMDSGEVTSRTYNKASEIAEYFGELPKDMDYTKQKETAPHAFASTDVSDGVSRPRLGRKAIPAIATKVKKVSPLRLTLAPNRHPFVEPSEDKGKQLFREASKVRLKEFPLVCSFLFRAIIEYATDKEMRAGGISDRNSAGDLLDLKGRFNAVCEHLIKSGRLQNRGDLNPIKTTLNAKHGSVTISALNGYIHNRYQKPPIDDLRDAWDHAVPLFTAIFGRHP